MWSAIYNYVRKSHMKFHGLNYGDIQTIKKERELLTIIIEEFSKVYPQN